MRFFYFGCRYRDGHYLWEGTSKARFDMTPWGSRIDGGLLTNAKIPDRVDGRVSWTRSILHDWIAFVWWDRSGDDRPGSNSGFYIKLHPDDTDDLDVGQLWREAQAKYPDVIARQKVPLQIPEYFSL